MTGSEQKSLTDDGTPSLDLAQKPRPLERARCEIQTGVDVLCRPADKRIGTKRGDLVRAFLDALPAQLEEIGVHGPFTFAFDLPGWQS